MKIFSFESEQKYRQIVLNERESQMSGSEGLRGGVTKGPLREGQGGREEK